MATLLLPTTRAALWLQRRQVPALDAAVLSWQLDADLETPARLQLALDLAAVQATLPALAPLARRRTPPASVWLALGLGRMLALAMDADDSRRRFAGLVTGCGADYPADQPPRLQVHAAEAGLPQPVAPDAAVALELGLGRQLRALQLMTASGPDGVVCTRAEAQVEGWAEAALPGRWVRLAGVDAALDGRYRVLASSRRFDGDQGLVTTLSLQRG
ncbi:MAG: hypothetical protein V4795_24055 [Pseudomonadota bacterium]